MRIAALGLVLLLTPFGAVAGEIPDHPVPSRSADRITRYRMWAMHQVSPKYPPYTYALVDPQQAPLTAKACVQALRTMFLATKRPTEPEHNQIVMLLQWLSIQPDPKPDYAKWIGCWPTGSPAYVAWQMHQSTAGSDDPAIPPFWYLLWTDGMKPMSSEACLTLVRKITRRRHVELIKWYDVRPDPPPDFSKRIGCLPAGFDPEDWKPWPKD